mmetsp:Transcript_2727/g.6018  ORF Transcript_2727/g.6018 Transcript_2727/m.6018 type:complete len:99 (-) Transcript_2727:226-522(-)
MSLDAATAGPISTLQTLTPHTITPLSHNHTDKTLLLIQNDDPWVIGIRVKQHASCMQGRSSCRRRRSGTALLTIPTPAFPLQLTFSLGRRTQTSRPHF